MQKRRHSCCALVDEGGALTGLDCPEPHQELAVRLALRVFHSRYPCPCPDQHEWLVECEAIAWAAVLATDQQDAHDRPSLPSESSGKHQNMVFQWSASLPQSWGNLDESKQQRVLWLARQTENALRRFWRQERRYYASTVALAVQNEESEWGEQEIADSRALELIDEVLEWVASEQLLEQLRERSDVRERILLQELLEGKPQMEIAQKLKITQQAVSKRLQKIRAKAEAILKEKVSRG